MQRRFYVDSPIQGLSVTIDGPDAHHISGVNRLKNGDLITLFDGSGKEFETKIVETSKKRVVVEVLAANEVSRESSINLTLAVALPKGDRQKLLVEKLVELGVNTLIPLQCERSVSVASTNSLAKLERRVIEASKQCGRNRLMQIASQIRFSNFVEDCTFANRFIAHPYNADKRISQLAGNLTDSQGVVFAVGPEGGFSDAEVEAARSHGWTPVQLCDSILRVETAATAAAAILCLK